MSVSNCFNKKHNISTTSKQPRSSSTSSSNCSHPKPNINFLVPSKIQKPIQNTETKIISPFWLKRTRQICILFCSSKSIDLTTTSILFCCFVLSVQSQNVVQSEDIHWIKNWNQNWQYNLNDALAVSVLGLKTLTQKTWLKTMVFSKIFNFDFVLFYLDLPH